MVVAQTVNNPEVRQCKLLLNFVIRIKNVLIMGNVVQKIRPSLAGSAKAFVLSN